MTKSRSKAPADRPLRLTTAADVKASFAKALNDRDGVEGAHCIHELWMRGEMAVHIDSMLEKLWKACGQSVPDWIPMRHIDWLPKVYEVAANFKAGAKGRTHIYLVLLDYPERSDPYGIYVGMSKYSAAARFDQHKAGIRAAGSVLKRGIEPLIGPVMHLQYIARAEAERIEAELAEALTAAGLFVQGGH